MNALTSDCQNCGGTGTTGGDNCQACNGTGHEPLARETRKPLYIS